MNKREIWEKELEAKMEAEGYERVTKVAAEIPVGAIAQDGGPILGVPGDPDKNYFDVDGAAIEKICAQVWDKLFANVQSAEDMQQMMLECCIQGYAFGYLQGRHEGLRLAKEEEAAKPEAG